MELGLEGKRELVTGSSSGIGTGAARMLAREGVSVIVHGRNLERTEAVAAELTSDMSSERGDQSRHYRRIKRDERK